MSFILSLVCVSHVPLNANAKNVLSHDYSLQCSPRYNGKKITVAKQREIEKKGKREERSREGFSDRNARSKIDYCISSAYVGTYVRFGDSDACTWEERGDWRLNKKRERERGTPDEIKGDDRPR